MIKTDNLKEYQSLSALQNYCIATDKCEFCKIKDICDCMSVSPDDLEIILEKEVLEK